MLSPVEEMVLRASNGEIVRLKYDAEENAAKERLRGEGLIRFYYDDDQPTYEATISGRLLLAELNREVA